MPRLLELSMRRPLLRWLRLPRQSDAHAESGASTSIAGRLRWSFLISSTLPLLIVGALLLYINTTAQQRSVYNDQVDLAIRVERDISRYVDELHVQVERFALKVRPTTSYDLLVEAAKDVVDRNYPNLLQVTVIDERGKERLHAVQLFIIPPIQLGDRGGDSVVQAALRDGVSTYSTIARNQDGVHSFTLTLPLRNDAGAITGALQVEINAEPIAQELIGAIANSKSYPYLVDAASGKVLFEDGQPNFTS